MIYDPDTLLTLKQQLTDMNESCRKAAPSDGGLFIQRRTKGQDADKKKKSMLTYQFQNKRNQNLQKEWVDILTKGKNSLR